MTSSVKKIDLFVGEDGNVEPLLHGPSGGMITQGLSNMTGNRTRQTTPPIRVPMITVSLLFICLVMGLFLRLNFGSSRDGKFIQYDVYYTSQRAMKCGVITFEEEEAVTSFDSGDVITVSDGVTGITAVKVNTSTPGMASFICLIRQDKNYGIVHAPVLPKPRDINSFMTQTNVKSTIDVMMRDDVWGTDVYTAVDMNELPVSLFRLCDGIPTYNMIRNIKEDVEGEGRDHMDNFDRVGEETKNLGQNFVATEKEGTRAQSGVTERKTEGNLNPVEEENGEMDKHSSGDPLELNAALKSLTQRHKRQIKKKRMKMHRVPDSGGGRCCRSCGVATLQCSQ